MQCHRKNIGRDESEDDGSRKTHDVMISDTERIRDFIELLGRVERCGGEECIYSGSVKRFGGIECSQGTAHYKADKKNQDAYPSDVCDEMIGYRPTK